MLAGQLFVCAVFGNLVSKWPLQGSVYAWSRELIGPRYGWFTGWAYMWGLTLTLSGHFEVLEAAFVGSADSLGVLVHSDHFQFSEPRGVLEPLVLLGDLTGKLGDF